jgi:ferric-dicitrate binding protein FerR (iron transport regulator)
MNEEPFYKKLVDRYTAGTASEEELILFFQLAGEGKLDRWLGEAFDNEEGSALRKPALFNIRRYKRLAIAACIVLLLSVGAFLFFAPNKANVNNTPNLAEQKSSKFNQLTTTRGEQKQVSLPDGTIIRLNAASTVSYEGNLTGKERVVHLQGEAYLEVARNAANPFKVQLRNNITIEVL